MNGERGTGNGERGAGNGERGTGSGERGTGSGERGTGNGELCGDTIGWRDLDFERAAERIDVDREKRFAVNYLDAAF